MRLFTLIICGAAACAIALLSSCGSSGGGRVSENKSIRGYNPGVGPFDSRGNYVERWADDKSKGKWWRKGSVSNSSSYVAEKEPDPIPKLPPIVLSKPPEIAAVTPPTKIPTYTPPQYTAPLPKPKVVSKPKYVAKPAVQPSVKVVPKRKPPIRYTVRGGDTLWSLSQRYKVSIAAIQSANGLKDNTLRTGKVILIPQY